jgi:hypothetical protein
VEQMRKPNEEMQICSFLWVYYGFPTSCYEGKNVEDVRFVSGLKMGQTDTSEVDCTCGIPDSGVGMALGYAEGKGVPYHRAISKYTPTWPRSFTPSRQEMRSLVAKMKLIPNRAMLEGKRLLFCDDSIVRGTQLRDNVKVLYEYGAKEVHIRIACPPLIYSCPFVFITFQLLNDTAGNQLQISFGCCEAYKRTAIYQRRTGCGNHSCHAWLGFLQMQTAPRCEGLNGVVVGCIRGGDRSEHKGSWGVTSIIEGRLLSSSQDQSNVD